MLLDLSRQVISQASQLLQIDQKNYTYYLRLGWKARIRTIWVILLAEA